MGQHRTDPPFDHALVAVCGECSGRDPRPKEIRAALKAAVKATGRKGAARVVETSCLDLCPKKAVAVAIARRVGAGITCHVVADRGDLRTLTTGLRDEVGAGP